MKKIFTFAAAILASAAMMAAEPTYQSQEWAAQADAEAALGSHDGVTIAQSGLSYGNLGSKGAFYYVAVGQNLKNSDSEWKYFSIVADAGNAIDSVSIYYCENGSNETNIAWIAWGAGETPAQKTLAHGETAGTTGSKNLTDAKWVTIDVHAIEAQTLYLSRSIREFKDADGNSISNFGKGQTFNILGFKVWTRALVINTDPVSSVEIAGDAAGYVGRSVKLTATTDVKADSIYWTVDGAVQENSNSKSFTLALDEEKTYSVVCYARNQYNDEDQFAASEAFSVVATVKPVLDQVSISGSTVWDWTKAASVSEIKWTGDQKDADPVLLANVDGMNNDENFNSQALLFSGEYPIRGGKYCQGPTIMFNTTVAGTLEVVYSHTGNDKPESDRRFLAVNGVNYGDGTVTASSNTTTGNIAIEAGDVVINGKLAEGDDVKYLRIYKITFTKAGEWPTAIDNTEAEVKAVKVIRNGQLFIEKNGVIYNAQGAVVK